MSKQTDRICDILRAAPMGLSATEVARQLGVSKNSISSRLSKLVAYGILRKVRSRPAPHLPPCAIYRILDDQQ